MRATTQDILDLAMAALQRAQEARTDYALRDNLDTALREIAEIIPIENIQPRDPGITPEVMPLIIQLQLLVQGGGFSAKSKRRKNT